MTRKKRILLFVLLLAFAFPILVHADEPVNEPVTCICGRPYHTETADGHDKYDCVECGQKISNCICKTCWCGAVFSEESDASGRRICPSCGQPASECTCADRDVMLNLENERRLGRLSVWNTPKPTKPYAMVVCTILTSLAFFFYGAALFRKSRETATLRREEEQRMKEEHDKILRKIEEQENGGKTDKQLAEEQQAVRTALRWNTGDINMGVTLYEMTNAVHFAQHPCCGACPVTNFILASAENRSEAEKDARDGKFGAFVQAAQEETELFDNDFYQTVKTRFAEQLGDGTRENELVHLANEACRFSLAASSALPILANAAKTSAQTTPLSSRKPTRFAEKDQKEDGGDFS